MAKGTIISLRVPPALLALVDEHCDRLGQRRKAPVSRSEFIVAALSDKLRHHERSTGKDVGVRQLLVAEEHRQAFYAKGKSWDCDCEACTAARRLEGV